MKGSVRIGLIAAALALFFAAASFDHPEAGPNVWSRIGPAVNLVDRGTLELGDFGRLTHDKRVVDGREFSDKAPGSIFIAAAAYGLLKVSGLSKGLSPNLIRYVVKALVLGIAAIIAFGYMVRLLKEGSEHFPLHLAGVAYILSAPVFAYYILYFGHGLAAAFVLVALVFLLRDAPGTLDVFVAGALFGLASAVEYPVVVLGLWAALLIGKRWKNLALYAVAVLLFGAVPIAIYNWFCFGSPFSFGYSEVFFPYYQRRMAQGLFGFTYPKLSALWLLTFSPARGLFLWAPAFLVGFAGLFLGALRDAGRRKRYIWSFVGFIIYLLLFSAFHEPSGGAAFGPRHLLPALPLLALGWPAFWSCGRSFARALLGLWIVGAVIALLFVGTEPLLPMRIRNPVVEFYPLVWSSDWIIGNWGRNLGVRGLWSLLVPLAFFAVAFVCAWRLDAGRLSVNRADVGSALYVYVPLALLCSVIALQIAVVRTDKGDLHYELANYHFVRDRFELAEGEYVAAAKHRRDPYIHYYLAIARFKLGECEAARSAIADSYRLRPDEYLVDKLRRLERWHKRCLEGRH